MSYLLAIDQGTTGTTVLVVRPDEAHVLGRGYTEHPQNFPQPGWVEHDAEAIWASVVHCTQVALENARVEPRKIAAIGITNQRETVVAWNARTGASIPPTIVWQDRRTSGLCQQLRNEGYDRRIRELTGLPTDPYFSGTKISWLLDNVPEVREAADAGDLRLGTVDSWLAWRLSGGDRHITDATNAARTLLYDIHQNRWSAELCERFGVDEQWLPEVVDSSGELAATCASELGGIAAPLTGIAGDQQSALFGQACFSRGQAKATYGTGAFVLVNSAGGAPVTESLISTIAWRLGGDTTYALEGAVFTAGASVQWLRDELRIIDSAPEIEALAALAHKNHGLTLVPAFAGLGAPIWDADARASIFGMTRGTTRADIARATLEAVAFRIRQNVDAMRAEGTDVTQLHVDGGMANNDLFLQIQADVLQLPVIRPANIETTSMGAAFLAGLGAGIYSGLDEIAATWQAESTVEPRETEWAESGYARFQQAVTATRAVSS